MILTDEGTWYSATDLLNWLGCAHRSALDARLLRDPGLRALLPQPDPERPVLRPDGDDGPSFDSPAAARGELHERAMLSRLESEGFDVVRIPRPDGPGADPLRARVDETVAAMRTGADVVFQAALLDAPWFGFADFLVRVDSVPSSLGDFAYEVRDTKLARHASASALIQMAHYGAMVEKVQGAPPPSLVVWLGTGEAARWPYTDAAPYLEEARRRFLAFHEAGLPTGPEPVAACPSCRWLLLCEPEWGPGDLRHVHRLTRRQRALLRESGIGTVGALAAAEDPHRPERIARPTFARLRDQARVQSGPQPFAVVRPQARSEGLLAVPATDLDDVYFDLEGDPFAAIPTLDYLWAFCDAAGAYEHRWAHSPEAEREAFSWFVSLLLEREARGPDWHVYHYNSYEITSMRRIAASWPVEAERQHWIDTVERIVAQRFVDLYRAVEAGVRTQDGSTSLKVVEKLAGYDRSAGAAAGAVSRADDSITAYEQYVMGTDEAERQGLLDSIRDYNAHDVRATLAVHAWLHGLQDELADEDLLDDPEPYVPSDKVLERAEETAQLRDTLIAAASGGDALPSGLSADGARLLAHILEWHRKETVAQYVDVLRLKEWALDGGESADEHEGVDAVWDELNGAAPQPGLRPGTEHESCLLDLELVEVLPPKKARKNAAIPRVFRCRPGAWKVKAGSNLDEALPPGADRPPISITVDEHDAQEGLVRFSRGEVPDGLGPFVLNGIVNDASVWSSLMRLGHQALSADPPGWAVLAFGLLDRVPPADADDMAARDGEEASDRARRIAAGLRSASLPVQGPPGTGKTWLGGHLVADAIERADADGRRLLIGVTANSHKVIDNLLLEAVRVCSERGLAPAVMHVGPPEKVVDDPAIAQVKSGGVAMAGWIAENAGRHRVVGATKYAWSRPEVTMAADVLLIDEAGQFSLADALAALQSARTAIALGDPQQLSAPVQAAHDESVNLSVLEHLAAGHDVLPDDDGVFLDVSHRMHPAVCSVVGALAYEGELRSSPDAARRSIAGPTVTTHGVTVDVRPGVSWVPLDGDGEEEVDAVVDLVHGLVGSVTVTKADVSTAPLDLADVLVVAPHNAHVNRIQQALPDARVGTVDRFQGQQGHVVVYSMGRLAERAGDVRFLYELNRLNVALSRARLMAIVVSHRDAVFPPVADPDDLRLVSRFIRAVGHG